ncbi:hypothetical protein NBRC116583_34820 [Arenicella sp. 4NH20-0111]|uniref:cadherin-like domain-containing protein n=1 Tax=Arenicella sp. 4NH20-0111 TaxID=3127648 RepID=UPI003109CC4F
MYFSATIKQILLVAYVGLASSLVHAQYIPNITRGEPGTLISSSIDVPEMNQMGRLAIMEPCGGYVCTIPEAPGSAPGSSMLNQVWDLSDPSSPRLVTNGSFTSMPYQAHGTVKIYDQVTGQVQIDKGNGEGFTLAANGEVSEESWLGVNPRNLSNLSSIFFPWSATNYGTYGFVARDSELYLDDQIMSQWDHLGMTGVIGFSMFVGDIMIHASDQSNTGMATYDVSDPSNPVLLDLINDHIGPVGRERGIGGYGAEIYGHYMVFASRPNEAIGTTTGAITVVDFEDPENLRLHCYIELPGEPMYVNFQDDHAFLDRYKVHIEDCRVDMSIPHDGRHDMSQYSLPLGNILVAGGIDAFGPVTEQGMSLWVHQSAPDTRPPFVAYHIPQDGRTNYPINLPISIHIPEKLRGVTMVPGQNIIVRPLGGEPIGLNFRFSHSGMLTIDPDGHLLPETNYEVILTGIQDYMGNAMPEFTFEFTTAAATNQLPPPEIISFTTASSEPMANATTTLLAQATGVEPLEYRFSSGIDGEPMSDWSTTPSFSIVYPEAAYYGTRLLVRDANGHINSNLNWRRIFPNDGTLPPPPAPIVHTSSQLACSSDEELLWAVNPDNDAVMGIAKSTQTIAVELTDSDDPRSVLVANDGNIWVAGMASDGVDVYGPEGNLISHIATGYGSAPFGLVASHGGSDVYATLYGSGELARFAVATREETGRIALGPTPRAIAITNDDSRLLVTRFISPQNTGQIWDIDTSSFTLTRTIELLKSDDPDTISNGHGVPNYLTSIIITAGGDRAYYAAQKANTDKGMLTGSDLDDDNTVRTLVGMIDLNANVENYDFRTDLDNRDSPSALAFSPQLDYLFVTTQGNNTVLAFPVNETGSLGQESGLFQTGLAPQGLCMDTENTHLYVKNFTERSVSQIDVENFLNFGGLNPTIETINTVTDEVLTPAVLAGKQIFYNASDERMSAEGYISCATCHIDGSHDGRTWDFTGRGEGLRNTPSLNGREGVRFGAVHWSGNFDEIQDFEHDIRDRFLGLGFLTNEEYAQTSPLGTPKVGLSDDLDNLAEYVNSLADESLLNSPHRTDTGLLTAEARRGRVLFVEQNCISCHSGDGFSDGQLHDVGTLRVYSGQRLGDVLHGIRTPPLFELFASAPYLHDGRAVTMQSVFNTVGGDVFQAEEADIVGAVIETQSVFENLRRSDPNASPSAVRLRDSTSDLITLNDVDGGNGGDSLISLRGMGLGVGNPSNVVINVNGQEHVMTLSNMATFGDEVPSMADTPTLPISLSPGSENTVTISRQSDSGAIIIDDITISRSDDIANASAHTLVNQLPTQSQADLVAYLLQIDAQGNNSSTPPVNTPPMGGIDQASTQQGVGLTLQITELLGNDNDADNDVLSITAVADMVNGTAVLDLDAGTVQFTPASDFFGDASFDYILSDGQDSVSVTVSVEVTEGSDPPSNTPPVGGNDLATTTVNTPVVFHNADLLRNDQDADGDELTIALVDDAVNGTAVLDREAGTITFMPDADFVGDARFVYLPTDGQATTYAVVRITVEAIATPVNTPPVGGADTVSTNQSVALQMTVASLLANDRDPDEGFLPIIVKKQDGTIVMVPYDVSDVLSIIDVADAVNGTVEFIDGMIIFTPANDFAGMASFNYLLSDGNYTITVPVSITVNPPN